MGLRFQRRVRIAPGLTLNLSKSGVGLSAGVRGARVGVGSRGMHTSVGIPGSGISFREQRSWAALTSRGTPAPRPSRAPHASQEAPSNPGSPPPSASPAGPSFEIRIADNGTVLLVDEAGDPLPDALVRRARAVHGEAIAHFLEEAARIRSGDMATLLGVHLTTPPPDPPAEPEAAPFSEPEPLRPAPPEPGLLGRFLPGRGARLESEHAAALATWEEALRRWRARRDTHLRAQAEERDLFLRAREGEQEAATRLLETRLGHLAWPRETLVTFELREEGRALCLDVDLPPAEEMPPVEARPAARGLRILLREKSATQLRREYMVHIHGILFRLVGASFHTLPALETVTASGYTQRTDGATGAVVDEYLLSARVHRSVWGEIHFSNLEALDLPAAFERFELRRSMTRTGIFRAIEPWVEGRSEP